MDINLPRVGNVEENRQWNHDGAGDEVGETDVDISVGECVGRLEDALVSENPKDDLESVS